MTQDQKELRKIEVLQSVLAELKIAQSDFILNRKETALKIKCSVKGDHILYNRKEKRNIEKAYEKSWAKIKADHNKELKESKELLKRLNVYENGTHGLYVESVFNHLTKIIG